MRDLIIFWTAIGLFLISLVGSSFYLGRKYEFRRGVKVLNEWKATLPGELEATCEQCRTMGSMMGYKKGLQTCDDLLDSINSQGRY